MSAPDFASPTLPPRPGGPSLHGNDNQVVERRSLRDYYVILRERLWIALPVALLVALSFGYYKAQEVPMYSATASMQFERPERVVQNEQVVDTAVRSDIDLNTYIQILNSGRLRTMVAQSLTPDEIKLLQRPYLKDLAPGANPPSVGGLLGSLSTPSIRNSFLINVTVSNRDAEGAALLANRYVEQFMRYLMENNFNPKAGSTAVVKGFVVGDSIIAQSVSIPHEKVSITLRDENGVPLWRMGRFGGKGK